MLYILPAECSPNPDYGTTHPILHNLLEQILSKCLVIIKRLDFQGGKHSMVPLARLTNVDKRLEIWRCTMLDVYVCNVLLKRKNTCRYTHCHFIIFKFSVSKISFRVSLVVSYLMTDSVNAKSHPPSRSPRCIHWQIALRRVAVWINGWHRHPDNHATQPISPKKILKKTCSLFWNKKKVCECFFFQANSSPQKITQQLQPGS